ncbi:MAG: DUF3147 family protein [Elusimicrobiota bacterium]
MLFWLKALISGLVIAGASELGKKFPWFGAVLVSLPLTSILTLAWLYRETGDAQKAAVMARGILLALAPSLLFFVIFPALIKGGWKFVPAMAVSASAMAVTYAGYAWLLARFGITL